MKQIFSSVMVMFFVLIPVVGFAQPTADDSGLIICNKTIDQNTGKFTDPCTYNHLIELGQAFIDFLIFIAIPLAALSFAYAGFLILTAAGNQSQREKGKDVFVKVAKGLIFMLAAWLIVDLILTALLNDPSYSILE